MLEQLTQPHNKEVNQAAAETLAVGTKVLVERHDGRIDFMKVSALSEPVDTFDEHNQPITEREVTVVGYEPELIDGQLGLPTKQVMEETLTPEAQQALAERRDVYERSEGTVHELGKVGLSRDLRDDVSVYHISDLENK